MQVAKGRRSAGCLLAIAGIGCSGPRGDSLLVGREGSGGFPQAASGGAFSGGSSGAGGTTAGGAGGASGAETGGASGASSGGVSGSQTGGTSAGTGGVPDDADALPPSGALCLKNPSFEGGVTFGALPPDWSVCQGSPMVAPAYNAFASSDGASHLGLMSIATDGVAGVARATLCAPLRAGETVGFSVDLTLSLAFSPFGSAYVQVWGSLDSCTKDQLLWTSPLLTEFEKWRTYCGTITPSRAYPYIVIAPSPDGVAPTGTPTVASGAYVLVDAFGARGCR